MKEGGFEQRRREAWDDYERLVQSVEGGKPGAGAAELPRKFREMCSDLALANHRMYRGQLVSRLNELVIRGYKLLYRSRRKGAESFMRFVFADFPRAVRQEWRLFWLCNALFWVPFFGMFAMAWVDLDWVQAILGPQGMASIESAYGGEAEQIAYFREQFGSNFMMFGFYVRNNVGIDFSIFAGGVVACLGTLFFLIYNGLAIGASAGYATYACNAESFWTFVAGHSSFELLGMVVAGIAGMRLGLAVLKPGRLSRGKALGVAAKRALPLILGAGGMTVLAAFVEGFWSAEAMAAEIKYTVGIAFWVLHAAYFLLLGRGARAA